MKGIAIIAILGLGTFAALVVLRPGVDGPSGGDASSSLRVCEIGSPALARIGSVSGQPEYLFDGVEDARLLPDGTIAVVNRNSQQVRVFDSDGQFVRAFGRRGDGPGELRDPIAIDLLGDDSLAVWDWSQGRVTVFPLEGGEPRAVRLDPLALNPDGSFGVGPGLNAFIIGFQQAVRPGRTPEEGHSFLHILSYSSGGLLVDTLGMLPYGQRLWVDEERREFGQPWFQAQGLFRIRDGVLYTANGDSAEVDVTVLSDSPERRSITWDAPVREVRPEHVQLHREVTTEQYSGNPYLAERIQRRWNTMPVADRFPTIDDLLVDERGRLWVREYNRPGDSGRRWRVLTPDGELGCTAEFPDSFEAFDFLGDRVVGLIRGENDVEFVEIRRIVEPD